MRRLSVLLPVLLWPAVAGAAVLPTTETTVGRLMLATVPNSLVVAPDSSRMIMAALTNPTLADKGIMINSQATDPRNDSARAQVNPINLFIDDHSTIPFDSFINPVFSPDSKRVAWTGRHDKTWHLVLDNKTLVDAAEDVPPTPIVFSPDSLQAAWTIKKGDQYLVTIGTAHWPPLDALSLGQMEFSPDSQHFAVIALTDAGWKLVVDGTPLPLPAIPAPPPAATGAGAAGATGGAARTQPAAAPRLDRLGPFAWRPDSTGLAFYAGFVGAPSQVFYQTLEGTVSFAGTPVDATMKLPPRFSPDGQRFAAAVATHNKWSVVDVPASGSAPAAPTRPEVDQILPQFLTFYQPPPPAGAMDQPFVTLYLAQQNKKWRLYIDHHPSDDAFDSIILGTFVLSPDKHHYAFAANRGGQVVVIRDGAAIGTYTECASGTFAFSPDARHLAYGARTAAGWSACVDGKPGIPVQALEGEPIAFSPDSSRIAFVALTGPATWRLIVGQDGALQSKPYDTFIKGSYVNWRADGSIVTLAVLKKLALRIEAKP